MNKLKVYKKYFETASDDTHLVMHRGYVLALVRMIEEAQTIFGDIKSVQTWDEWNEKDLNKRINEFKK